MTLRTWPDVTQGSEEWNELRRGIITASAVGQFLTPGLEVANNESTRRLIATLAAERISGWTEPTHMNADMMRGVLHEPIARDTYAAHNQVTVTEVGFMLRDDWGHSIGASPDGLIEDDGGLEVKCPRAQTHVRTIVADRVPAQYMAQLQTSLLVSGRAWWDFASFCSGFPLWTKRVFPDPAWHAAIVAAAAAAEEAIEALALAYADKSVGLPPTERIDPDLELVI